MMKKNQIHNQLLLVLITIVMLFLLIPVFPSDGMESVEAAETKLQKPQRSKGKVIYDCVWFGSYPQAEIVTDAMLKEYETYYGETFALLKKDGDFIVDNNLYQTLKEAEGWDINGDIALSDGNRYHRINNRDTVKYSYIDWKKDTSFHYFKYQPIKWKVLSANKDEALLFAEHGLDRQDYHMTPNVSVTWEVCTLRSWLNGYGSETNQQGTDFTARNFINCAFDLTEKSAIKTKKVKNREYAYKYNDKDKVQYCIFRKGKTTSDKIFLLSYKNVINTDYGFSSYMNRSDNTKKVFPSAYAWALGANPGCLWDNSALGAEWSLRSVFCGNMDVNDNDCMKMVVRGSGVISPYGSIYNAEEDDDNSLIVPALYLDLSASGSWSYAGTVSIEESKNGLVKESGKSYYYKDGRKLVKFTGLMKNSDKKWYYVKNGVWQPKYTGMVKRSSGKWYYVEKGIRKNTTGLVKHAERSWWYVKNGEWQPKYTGMVKQPGGKWYYVKNGKKEYTTGLVKHADGKWWYVKNGEWQPKYKGIVKQSNGRSYYIEKGKRNNITGYVTVKGKRYKLEKGEVKSK